LLLDVLIVQDGALALLKVALPLVLEFLVVALRELADLHTPYLAGLGHGNFLWAREQMVSCATAAFLKAANTTPPGRGTAANAAMWQKFYVVLAPNKSYATHMLVICAFITLSSDF